MNNFYEKRRNEHFLMLLKYWRYVFNDHFVIALFFLLGALAYGYSQSLPKLSVGLWWAKPLIILVALGLVQLGRLATLFKFADPIFLLPQTKKINQYLKKAFGASLLLAELMVAFGFIVMLPFILMTTNDSLAEIGAFGVTLLVLKFDILTNSYARLYQFLPDALHNNWLWKLVIPFITILVGVLINPWIGLVIAVITMIQAIWNYRLAPKNILNWRVAVDTEGQRMLDIYRFFNLFTDVPEVQGTIKRRRWLDFLLVGFKKSNQVYSYLYARGLLRGTEISGLVTRLTLIGMLILFFVPQGWLNMVLYLMFIYLIAVQIVPFYWHFDNHVFTHLYPQSISIKLGNFKRVMETILLVCMVLMWVVSMIQNFTIAMAGIKLIFGIAEVLLLTRYYVDRRLKNK